MLGLATPPAFPCGYDWIYLGPLRAVETLLLTGLDHVEVLGKVVVVYGFLVLASFVHEPDAV